MYNPDIHSVRSGNYHTLTITTPVAIEKDPEDYENLKNKPSINGVVLIGDTSFEALGMPDFNTAKIPEQALSNEELDDIINS